MPELGVELDAPQLRLGQGLQFKLGFLFILITVTLTLAAWQIGKKLVQSSLVEDTQRYQRESGLRLVQDIESQLDRTRVLAATIAELSQNSGNRRWPGQVVPLINASGLEAMVSGVGWWPEPRSDSAPRRSYFWLADGVGELSLRDDYNKRDTIPYWKENWYTPAKQAPAGSCFWSHLMREPLSRRNVVICALPVRDRGGFKGAVTVHLDANAIEQRLRKLGESQSGYTILTGRENRIIAIAGAASGLLDSARPRNVAELAQKFPSFNSLALELHERNEQFLSRSVQSAFYDPEVISKLLETTRDSSRKQLESDMALIWNGTATGRDGALNLAELRIAKDVVLKEDGAATIIELSAPFWKLVRVTSAKEGIAGAEYFFSQSLIVLIGAVIITLFLVFAGLRFYVLRPLSNFARTLSRVRSLDEAQTLQLPSAARNELGIIGQGYNERVRQLREANDRALTQQSQLVVEAGERARADEQSLRLRERSNAILSSIDVASITVDSHGKIEGMNAPAERLTGVMLRDARGRPCGEIFRIRLAHQSEAAPDFAASVIASSARIEYTEGLFLKCDGREEREIKFIGTPLQGPGRRSLGAVLIFDLRETEAEARHIVIDRRSNDPITGLLTRPACDRRIRDVIAHTKNRSVTHALAVVDIDRLRKVNETLGMQAGDHILLGVAGVLVESAVGGDGDVFRMGGDSFALVIEDTSEDEVMSSIRTLCATISETPMHWAENKISTTVSIGVLMIPANSGASPLEMLRRADQACERAKALGRNTVQLYDDSIAGQGSDLIDQASWVRRIRAGLDDGLLHLTTQQMQILGGKKGQGPAFRVSVALEDEEGFWAEPETFLPVASRSGHAAELERWALQQMLDHLGRNPEVITSISLCSIALSADSISDSTTLETIANALQEHAELDASKICFILGDDVLNDIPAPCRVFCEAVHSLKCKIALQNDRLFDAASSELARKLPADFVRIDSRMFKDVGNNSVDRILAESAVQIARSLKRKVIAYEIGDRKASDIWKELGADYLEGPEIARPSPVVFTVPS